MQFGRKGPESFDELIALPVGREILESGSFVLRDAPVHPLHRATYRTRSEWIWLLPKSGKEKASKGAAGSRRLRSIGEGPPEDA
jgi:hypothetical protein